MNDHMLIPTRDLPAMYASGKIIGCTAESSDFSEFQRKKAAYARAETLDHLLIPTTDHANLSSIQGTSKGKLCTPYKWYLKQDPSFALKGAQLTGDCVSWGVRTVSDITRCWNIWVLKKVHEYLKRQATALIYSGRGFTGQGADPSRLSRWHVETGFLLEDLYTLGGKQWDFRSYKDYVSLGMRYGKTGLPSEVISEAKKHRHKVTTLVKDLDALADLTFNGYPGHCGSSMGVSDKGGPVSRRSGSWAHDMAIVGFDDTPECHEKFGGRIWFWDQSWGIWNNVTNIPEAWKPWGEGMFALNDSDTWFAVRQLETWVFSDTDGFPAQPYDHMLI